MLIRRRADLDQFGVQGEDIMCGGGVPNRAGIFKADLLAVVLQLAMVIDTKLQELTVLPVGRAVRVVRIRVRRVVLVFR